MKFYNISFKFKYIYNTFQKLDEILNLYGEGKNICRYYKSHKSLNETNRKALVRLIIQHEVNKACSKLSLKGDDKLKEFT